MARRPRPAAGPRASSLIHVGIAQGPACGNCAWRALPSRKFNPLAELLGEPDEDPLRASDVTEPILILVLRQFTNQLGSVRAEPGERIAHVLHAEHDAQAAARV